MRVLLPAPFSPTSTWISPPRTVSGMRSLAVSAPYRFVTDRSSTATSVAAALAGSADAALTSTGDLPVRRVWGVGGPQAPMPPARFRVSRP